MIQLRMESSKQSIGQEMPHEITKANLSKTFSVSVIEGSAHKLFTEENVLTKKISRSGVSFGLKIMFFKRSEIPFTRLCSI